MDRAVNGTFLKLCVCAVLFCGCGGGPAGNQVANEGAAASNKQMPTAQPAVEVVRESCRVLEILDAATIAVSRHGQRAIVRLILVDPEGFATDSKITAISYLDDEFKRENNQAHLEPDPSLPDVDDQGRLLRYVFVGQPDARRPHQDFLNFNLIAKALAPLPPEPSNATAYTELFDSAARYGIRDVARLLARSAELAGAEIEHANSKGVVLPEHEAMAEGLKLMDLGFSKLAKHILIHHSTMAHPNRTQLRLARKSADLASMAVYMRARGESEDEDAVATHLTSMADLIDELANHCMNLDRCLAGLDALGTQ